MKKLFLIFLVLYHTNKQYAQTMFESLCDTLTNNKLSCVSNNDVKSINLSFSISDFIIKEENGMYSIDSDRTQLCFLCDTLNPKLPFLIKYVLIESDKDYESFSYTYQDTIINENISLKNNDCPFLNTASFCNSSSISHQTNRLDIYPTNIIEYTGTYISDGYKFLGFIIYPFQYDRISRQLVFVKNITININQVISQNVVSYSNISTGKNIKDIVCNKEDVDIILERNNVAVDYEYLIITDSLLLLPFIELANWKTTKGVRAKVLTIEKIANTYLGLPLYVKIKEALKDYYNGQYHGLKYVLLAGNTQIVPSPICYIQYDSHTSTTPCDFYYTCFDTMNWDKNGNGKLGEIEDSVDIAPEISVSRIPVSTISEAQLFVDRIISYEKNPNTDNWKDNILMCGMMTLPVPTYIHSNAELEGNYLYNNVISNYWNCELTRLYDTATDFPGGANYDFNADHLQTELEKGYTIVHIDTHGFYDYILVEDDNGNNRYTSNDADSLINNGYSNIITTSCLTNDFTDDTCMSKSFIFNPNSGIISYLGYSAESWYPESFYINRGIYKILLEDGNHQLAESLKNNRLKDVGLCGTYNTPRRWNLFSLNLLGDPETSTYLSEPLVFEDVQLSIINGILNVNSNIPNCKICIHGKYSSDNELFIIEDSVSCGSFSNIGDEGTISITKNGYIPFVARYLKNAYIQNETFDKSQIIVADKVYIGRNVTSNKDEGPVMITNGKLTIFANEVTIKNSFEVSLGAEYEIKYTNY